MSMVSLYQNEQLLLDEFAIYIFVKSPGFHARKYIIDTKFHKSIAIAYCNEIRYVCILCSIHI